MISNTDGEKLLKKGVNETTIIKIKKKLIELTDKDKSVAKKLEDKYGAGTLSLETGEIQPLP